jgi:mono/diheme cytochrome c family protein
MNLRSRWIQIGIVVIGIVIVLTVLALLLQTNPPVKQEPAWDSPQTRALAQRACFDCHSNETVWNVYTRLPVGSWLAVFDTLRGRRELNLSEWTPGSRKGREAGEQIQKGEMPPAIYTLMHPEALLSPAEKQQLINGLQNSLK